MAAPVFSFTPPPEEQAYYAALFDVADTTRSGSLAGKEAVTFMAKSNVPMETLKNIWTMVDNPKTSALDRPKFYNAVRLIQLHQNGQRPQDATLATPPGLAMRPPMFEGISGISVPMPGAGGPGQAPPPQQQQQQQQQQTMAMAMPPTQPQQQQQPQQAMAPPAPQQQTMQQPQSMAITAQDPYIMYPQEQSRYEALFPQYEVKKDGYVYGSEAVALFSKSGADKASLRQIWNMVDDPVDNRLSKLEFAIAMHLIVCTTKKNLPLPPSLPPSLQAIKDQEAGGSGGAQQQQQQQMPPPVPPSPARNVPSPSMQAQMPPPQQQQPPPMMPGMGVGAAPTMQSQQQMYQQQAPPSPQPQPVASSSMSIPSPTLAPQQPPAGAMQVPPSPMGTYGQGTMQQSQRGMGGMSSLPGPPPIAAPGGASISDAFEGIAPSSSSFAGSASYNAPPSPVAAPPAAAAVAHTEPDVAASAAGPPPVPDISVADPTPVAANTASKSTYQLEDDHGELAKLRATLQKLQAENISLKAKLGDVSEEEADVRKEIGQTISEVGRLSQELTGLREKVSDAKAALIEATAELKAQKEKKGMIADLIDDTNQTLGALNDAHNSIQDLQATDEKMEQQQEQRNAAGNAFESGLFGGFDDAPPASAAASTPAPAAADADAGADPAPGSEPEHPIPPAQPPAQMESHEQQQMYGAPESQGAYHDGVMGGAAPVSSYEAPTQQPPIQQHAMVPMGGVRTTSAHSSLNPDSFGHNASGVAQSLSTNEIDAIKKQVTELDRKAVAAEDTQRQLMSQVDALRREAEQAEVLAAEKVSAAEGTKKKRFGKGGKKGAMKDAEAARAAALEKKQKAEAAQAALSNAQAEAIKAKRQADELRQKAEEAELQAASAASMIPGQQAHHEPPSAPAVPQMEVNYSGYAAAPPPMGSMPDSKPISEAPGMSNGHGMTQQQPMGMQQQQTMGTMGGGAPMGGMMAANAQSDGDDDGIPTPPTSQHDDYSNPFGGW